MRKNEIEYRFEIDSLKSDKHHYQIKNQELEHQLADLKLKQLNIDHNSIEVNFTV